MALRLSDASALAQSATIAGCLVSFALVLFSVLAPERGQALYLVEISLLFPAFYMWLSWYLGGFRLGKG